MASLHEVGSAVKSNAKSLVTSLPFFSKSYAPIDPFVQFSLRTTFCSRYITHVI